MPAHLLPASNADRIDARRDGLFELREEYASAVYFGGGAFAESGDYVHDSSLYGHGGVINGVAGARPLWTWSEELNRWGLEFASLLQDRVQIPHATPLSLGSPHSISLWFFPPASGISGFQRLIDKANSYCVMFGFPGTGLNWFFNSGSQSVTYNTTWAQRWYHAGFTFDGATMRLYLDGVQVATTSTTTAPTPNASELWLGTITNLAADQQWNGKLVDVLLLPFALSAGEVAELADPAFHPLEPLRSRRQYRRAIPIVPVVVDIPCPYRPSRLESADSLRSRVESADTLRRRVEPTESLRRRPDSCN